MLAKKLEVGRMSIKPRQDTAILRTNKKPIRKVGCWNVRNLYQTGKLAQVIREMENYNIDLL